MGEEGLGLLILLMIITVGIIIAIIVRNKGKRYEDVPNSSSAKERSNLPTENKSIGSNGLLEGKKIYCYHIEAVKIACKFCGAEKESGTDRCPVCGEK